MKFHFLPHSLISFFPPPIPLTVSQEREAAAAAALLSQQSNNSMDDSGNMGYTQVKHNTTRKDKGLHNTTHSYAVNIH